MSHEAARSIGVIRPHVFTCALGPRRSLNRALDRALGTLAERLRRFRLTPADEAVDFFWNRPAPRVLVREQQVRQDWHFSPTVMVNLSRPFAVSSRDETVLQPVKAPPALPSPVLMRTIERRIEMRVLDRTTTVLRQTIDRRRPEAPARPSPPVAVPVPAPQMVVRTDAPVVRTEMVFVRTPPPPVAQDAGVPTASTRAAASLQTSAPPSPPQAPQVRLERITAEVIRALDARLIARRERMGRS